MNTDSRLEEKIRDIRNGKAALFFDLDGTLVGSNGQVSDEDKEALLRLIDRGYYLFVNTGRAKGYLPKKAVEDIAFTGIICGASYVECGGEILKNHTLSPKAKKEVLDFCRENEVPLVLEGVSVNCSYNYDRVNDALKITEDKELAKKEGYIYIDDYINGNIETTKATFIKILNGINTDGITELRVILFKNYAEALIKGNNKANAMDVVLDHFGLEPYQTVSFGDSENDIEMLRASGISVAMPHAAPAAKECADMVCTIRQAIDTIFGK